MDTQQVIRHLLPTATAYQLRAALTAVLDATLSAQSGPDFSDYGVDGSRSSRSVDDESTARSSVGAEIDSSVLSALRTVEMA
jgi:hypothetical protein